MLTEIGSALLCVAAQQNQCITCRAPPNYYVGVLADVGQACLDAEHLFVVGVPHGLKFASILCYWI
jgi:hypothetical protein